MQAARADMAAAGNPAALLEAVMPSDGASRTPASWRRRTANVLKAALSRAAAPAAPASAPGSAVLPASTEEGVERRTDVLRSYDGRDEALGG